ncbi:MAG: hypothetical protein H7839_10595 [Magnetococcus sp. YQC-5]
MELELAEVTETITGVLAQGTLANGAVGTGVGTQVVLNGSQQGVGGIMNSLAIGNAGGVAKTAAAVGQNAATHATTAAVSVKTGSMWTGTGKLGLGKWSLTLVNVMPLLFVGTLIAVGVGVYSFLQYRNANEHELIEVVDPPG